MPDLVEQMYCAEQIHIPPTFPYILKQYAKAAIRTQPYDLLKWSAAYFRAMANGEVPPVKERLEYPPPKHPYGITPGYLRILVNQFRGRKTVLDRELYAKWHGICLDRRSLRMMLEIGSFGIEVHFLRFIAVAAGHLTNSLTKTMILICELLTEEPEGGCAMIPYDVFDDLYRFLGKLDCGPVEPEEMAETPLEIVNYVLQKLQEGVSEQLFAREIAQTILDKIMEETEEKMMVLEIAHFILNKIEGGVEGYVIVRSILRNVMAKIDEHIEEIELKQRDTPVSTPSSSTIVEEEEKDEVAEEQLDVCKYIMKTIEEGLKEKKMAEVIALAIWQKIGHVEEYRNVAKEVAKLIIHRLDTFLDIEKEGEVHGEEQQETRPTSEIMAQYIWDVLERRVAVAVGTATPEEEALVAKEKTSAEIIAAYILGEVEEKVFSEIDQVKPVKPEIDTTKFTEIECDKDYDQIMSVDYVAGVILRKVRESTLATEITKDIALYIVEELPIGVPLEKEKDKIVEHVQMRKFRTEVKGIGGVVSEEQLESVMCFMRFWADRQEDTVMPRNIIHFLCPRMDPEEVPDDETAVDEELPGELEE